MDKNASYNETIEELENSIKIQKNQIDGHMWILKGLQSLVNNQKKCIDKLLIGK